MSIYDHSSNTKRGGGGRGVGASETGDHRLTSVDDQTITQAK